MEILIGVVLWFLIRCIASGFYTVNQNERAVKTVFGKAQRMGSFTTLNQPAAKPLRQDELERFTYPQVRVIPPGGPYFKFPWERIYKVSVATRTVNIAYDPENALANQGGTILEAVTKDQLNTGLKGQLRFAVSEQNLFAFIFGIKNPLAHIMGYFVSILRERIANFEAPAVASNDPALAAAPATPPSQEKWQVEGLPLTHIQGISINDLRKNLSSLNSTMESECSSSIARYGIALDAALITEIDPPPDVESALAAINTAHNQVSSEISLAHASADQKIVQSKKAVEIETLKAQGEVQLLTQLSDQLKTLKSAGSETLSNYLRNFRLKLYGTAKRVIMEAKS